MDIDDLVKVTSRAWSLSILALLHEGTPGRQAALLSATGAGRTALSQSIAHLVRVGLLSRNPGHGHPLRPEYRLTTRGIEMAAVASGIAQLKPDPEGAALLRRTWTLPVLVVSRQPRNFTQIKTALHPVTDRALSRSLKALQSQHWLGRGIDADRHPPRPIYYAVGLGARIGATVPFSAD